MGAALLPSHERCETCDNVKSKLHWHYKLGMSAYATDYDLPIYGLRKITKNYEKFFTKKYEKYEKLRKNTKNTKNYEKFLEISRLADFRTSTQNHLPILL